jgi:hypothetical protein
MWHMEKGKENNEKNNNKKRKVNLRLDSHLKVLIHLGLITQR